MQQQAAMQQEMVRMTQQQVPPPVVLPVAPPPPPVELPIRDRVEDGVLKQFLSLGAPTFTGEGEEDPRRFLRELNRRFQLMGYEGPRRVHMAEFMLRGPAQEWIDMVRGSRPAGEAFTWEDFQASLLMEY